VKPDRSRPDPDDQVVARLAALRAAVALPGALDRPVAEWCVLAEYLLSGRITVG